MANGIVIGGGNTNVGEVYAQQIAQARAQANQQRAQEQQIMMQRAQMQQAQRQADTENQYRYAALNQAASEKQADREFQRQEAASGRGFSREENQAQREGALSMEDKRIGASKESQATSQEFSGEQNRLHLKAQKDIETERNRIASENRKIDLARQDEHITKEEKRYLDMQKENLDQRKIVNEEHAQRIEMGKAQLENTKLGTQSLMDERTAKKQYQQDVLADKADARNPEHKRREAYAKATELAQKKLDGYLKQSGKPLPQAEYDAALSHGIAEHMQGMGYGDNLGMPGAAKPYAAGQFEYKEEADPGTALARQRAGNYGKALSAQMPWYQKAPTYFPIIGPSLGASWLAPTEGQRSRANDALQGQMVSSGATPNQAQQETMAMIDAMNSRGGYR